MFKQVFLFEWRYFTSQPSFYITTAIFFALGFLTPSAGFSHWGSLLKNGPYLITFSLLFLGLLSQFLVVNFVADTAMRDNASGMAELLYCKPINAMNYQLGRFFGALLDPFGLRTFSEVTHYWSVEQRNTQLMSFSGILLYNRLLWLSIGVVVLFGFGRLSSSLVLPRQKSKKSNQNNRRDPVKSTQSLLENRTDIKGEIGEGWRQLWACTRFETRQVVLDPAFYILLGFTLLMLVSILIEPAGLFGNTYWPTTQTMVEYIRNALSLLSLIVITYYSGEIVWAERTVNFGDIYDSYPTSNLVIWCLNN
jgi:hypothetical protein